MSALHSTPVLNPGATGQYRQHCTDTDPDHKKGKCISIDADRRVWKCYRCDIGGSLDQQHQLTEEERQQAKERQSKAEREHQRERRQQLESTRKDWDRFSETGTSEYLNRKGFASIKGLRFGRDSYGQFAAMPLRGPGGDFRGFQRFYDTGDKKLAPGTHKTGAYFLIPGSKSDVVICEGLATGASVALATGYTVAIAVDCGNIGPTIASLKAVNSKRRFIIGADHDQWGKENAGLKHGYAAAQQHQAEIAAPDFTGLDTSGKPTDFNDLHQLAGLAEVARQIEQAKPAAEFFCQQTVTAIQRDKPRLVAVRASHGVGKTQHIIRPIVADSPRAVVIGHRIALMRDTANRLDIDCYQDIKSAEFAARSDKMAICINSLATASLQPAPALQAPAVVVLDEYEQIKAALCTASTMKDSAPAIYDRLMQLLASAEQIILSDADLNRESVSFLEVLLGTDAMWYEYEPQQPELSIRVLDYDAGITELQQALSTGRVMIGADSKTVLEQIKGAIPSDQAALLVSSNTKGCKEVRDFLSDPEAHITGLDHLLFSPSMGSGVSLETEHFTQHYMIYSGVVTPADFIQMMRRDRTAKQLTVLIRNVRNDDSLETDPGQIITSMELRKRADRGPGFTFQFSDFDTLTAIEIGQRNTAMRRPKASLLALFRQRGFTVTVDDTAPKHQTAAKQLKAAHTQQKRQRIQAAESLDAVSAAELENGSRAKTPELAAQLERYQITDAYRLAPDAEIPAEIFERWNDGRGLADLQRADNVFGDPATVEARSQAELKYAISQQKNPTLQRRIFRRLLQHLNIDCDTGQGSFTAEQALQAWTEFSRWRRIAAYEGIHLPRKAPKYPARWAAEQLGKLGLATTSTQSRATGRKRVYEIHRNSWQMVQDLVQRRAQPAPEHDYQEAA